MTSRQRAATLLEKAEVAHPATVSPPPLLQADHGGQRLLERSERLHLALHLEMLNREAGVAERGSRAIFIVREARRPSSLAPLVGVKGDEREGASRGQRASGARHDRVRHAEVSDDEIGRPLAVLRGLGVDNEERRVGEPGGGRPVLGLGDRRGGPVDADDAAAARRQGQGEPARARADVERRGGVEALGLEQAPERRAQAGVVPRFATRNVNRPPCATSPC